MATIIVTRHAGLVQYLKAKGLAPEDAVVKEHVLPNDVIDNDVIGVLPLWLAHLAKTMTVVDLKLPPELRGAELTMEQVAQYASDISRYQVKLLPPANFDPFT